MFDGFTEEDWLMLADLYASYVVGCVEADEPSNKTLSPREYFAANFEDLADLREFAEFLKEMAG